MTILALEKEAAAALAAAGIPSASFEAAQLLRHLLGEGECLPLSRFLMRRGEQAPPSLPAALAALLERRCAGYPLQYLLGEWEFFGLPFRVGEGVLIPRPDTEVLVETGLALAKGLPAPAVADLCSGSGCVAAALSCNLPPAARLYAVELSQAALPYLRENLCRNGCRNVQAVQADALCWQPGEPLDLVVSNPPYLASGEMEALSREVRFEPSMALEAPEEGLLFYRVLSRRCREYLRPGGWLAFEVGYRQSGLVAALLEENGYREIALRHDLAGIPRVVLGRCG